jgi:hypothetical protein
MYEPRPEDFALEEKLAAYHKSFQENRERFYSIDRYVVPIPWELYF